MWDWSDNIELSLYNALTKAGVVGGVGLLAGLVDGSQDLTHWPAVVAGVVASFVLDLITRREGYLKKNKFKEAVQNGDDASL